MSFRDSNRRSVASAARKTQTLASLREPGAPITIPTAPFPSVPNPDLAPGYRLAQVVAAGIERDRLPPGWPPELTRLAVLRCTRGTNRRTTRGEDPLQLGAPYRITSVYHVPETASLLITLADIASRDVTHVLLATVARVRSDEGGYHLRTEELVPVAFQLAQRSPLEPQPQDD